jgi:hypothetical protein
LLSLGAMMYAVTVVVFIVVVAAAVNMGNAIWKFV